MRIKPIRLAHARERERRQHARTSRVGGQRRRRSLVAVGGAGERVHGEMRRDVKPRHERRRARGAVL